MRKELLFMLGTIFILLGGAYAIDVIPNPINKAVSTIISVDPQVKASIPPSFLINISIKEKFCDDFVCHYLIQRNKKTIDTISAANDQGKVVKISNRDVALKKWFTDKAALIKQNQRIQTYKKTLPTTDVKIQ